MSARLPRAPAAPLPELTELLAPLAVHFVQQPSARSLGAVRDGAPDRAPDEALRHARAGAARHQRAAARPERFLRIHRAHIVNLDFVAQLVPYDGARLQVELRDGTKLMASRTRSRELRDLAV